MYGSRRQSDRLPLDVLAGYLAASGVVTPGTETFSGPVLTAVRPGRGSAGIPWRTVADLRVNAGYPADRIPTRLTGWERQ